MVLRLEDRVIDISLLLVLIKNRNIGDRYRKNSPYGWDATLHMKFAVLTYVLSKSIYDLMEPYRAQREKCQEASK